MHPLDDVTRGEKLIKTVYEAIRNSPQWENSLLLVTFDEHGGFYDHVRPPAAVPPGDTMTASYIQHHFQYDQLGVRVPALVISPLIPRGVIDHTIYDHTSMLASVERLFGMKPLTNETKRPTTSCTCSRSGPRGPTRPRLSTSPQRTPGRCPAKRTTTLNPCDNSARIS